MFTTDLLKFLNIAPHEQEEFQNPHLPMFHEGEDDASDQDWTTQSRFAKDDGRDHPDESRSDRVSRN